MNKEKMELISWLAECYTPVEFSVMKCFTHDHINGSNDSPIFYGYRDSIVKHISVFINYCKKNDFLHQLVMMKYFFMSLKGFAQIWYESLGKCMFTSFV
jgi:hypothetical protein